MDLRSLQIALPGSSDDDAAVEERIQERLKTRGVALPPGTTITGGFLVQVLLQETWDTGDIDVVCELGAKRDALLEEIVRLNPGSFVWDGASYCDQIAEWMQGGRKGACPKNYAQAMGRPTNEDDCGESWFRNREKQFELKRAILKNGERIDVIACKDPLAHVMRFDLSVCRVAFTTFTKELVIQDSVNFFKKRGTYDRNTTTPGRIQKYVQREFMLEPEEGQHALEASRA